MIQEVEEQVRIVREKLKTAPSLQKIHFHDDNFDNVMEHFYDSTGMTILILS